MVTDVALLPLTSQQEASDAIQNAIAFSTDAADSDGSESDSSDTEGDRSSQATVTEVATNPGDESRPYRDKNDSGTSVAEDVATGNVSFGRFATQWLSRQRWPGPNPAASSPGTLADGRVDTRSTENPDPDRDHVAKEQGEQVESVSGPIANEKVVGVATLGLLPRILKTTKMIFTSRSYFYSYDVDLTRNFESLGKIDQPPVPRNMNPLVSQKSSLSDTLADAAAQYFWNRKLGARFLDSGFSHFLTPVLQGFVGQREFILSKSPSSHQDIMEVKPEAGDGTKGDPPLPTNDSRQSFLLTLISRRSTKRSGLRYLRRGIDDEGNCANFVETEQILSAADWDSSVKIRTFLQIRGSIPLYFSQSPYSFKPAVIFHNSPQQNQKAFVKHFTTLRQQYEAVHIALLVDRHATERPIGEAFENLYNQTQERGQLTKVAFKWFDFHAECRGMKFENVSRLVTTLTPFLDKSSETVIQNNTVTSRQTGVIRTNCMDCLDRTNVAQSAFAQHILQKALTDEGFTIDFVTDASTNWFNTLWADNGDAISRLYAGTAALKGDYTRTRKRNWRGAMNDFGLTLTRYYGNMVNDYFSQAVIDLLLSNLSWRVFEDFESSMMSADPGISVSSARESAIETCSKIVISDPDTEDLLYAWTMMVPAVENTLRTLPMEEAIVLLSDAALYCCRMDWTTEKVARVERVDIRNIKKIKVGTYVVSTFTERQMDADINQGVVIYYVSGRGDGVRVNTRSLSNYHETAATSGSAQHGSADGGAGLLSWLPSLSGGHEQQERIMALKVVNRGDEEFGLAGKSRAGSPREIASGLADEIRRAITGSTEHGEQRGGELIEEADVIGPKEAKKRTGYLEQVGQQLRKLVWA